MAKTNDTRTTMDNKKRKARRPLAGNEKRQKPTSTKPARRVVAASDLKWEPVPIPEMFNDAEGFFGLEVVEGVDIVRDGENVRFVTAAAAAAEAETDGSEFEGFDDPVTESEESSKVADADRSDKKEPSEEALDGEPVEKAIEKKEKQEKKKTTKETTKKTKDGKNEGKKGKGTKTADDELSKGGGFSVLNEVEDTTEDGADVSAWVPLNLSLPLLSCLSQLKFSTPTAIQAATIPEILAGHDVIGKAATGSGKTLAFSIPIIQRWLSLNGSADAAKKTGKKVPLALILSPTRELAHQITKHIKDLCAALPTAPYICSITGGLSTQKQQRQLELADVVVGTPGRLWEVLSSSTSLLTAFRSISFLVVDEADRLLTDGHFKEAEEILLALDRETTNEEYEGMGNDEDDDDNSAPKQKPRQTLVFSATFNKGLQQKLSGKGRFDLMDQAESMEHLLKRLNFREEVPKFIDANPVSQMAGRLKEGLVQCGAMEKDLYLYALLMLLPSKRTLVFTNSIGSVRRLTPMLQNLELPAIALHSEMIQRQRLRSVEQFTAAKNAKGSILVATDVAARGLDIPGIDAVIHYHVPNSADFYVHRSGRTARANNAGVSVLLCAPKEVVPTRRLVAKIHANAAARAGDKDVNAKSTAFFIRTLDIDRRIVGRLRERIDLAKQLADSAMAKGRAKKDEVWLREMAETLGIDYEEAAERMANGDKATGGGRSKGNQISKNVADDEDEGPQRPGMSKAEMRAVRFQLKQLLSKPINTGVSERYLASGGVNMKELLRDGPGDFLGAVPSLGFDD